LGSLYAGEGASGSSLILEDTVRETLPKKLELARARFGEFASDPSWGPYGWFRLMGPCGTELTIVASGGDYPASSGWEHVSISTPRRPPNWQEMCFAKDAFWTEEECVVQFHPPKSVWVNNHPYCLHLWKPPHSIQLPPSILIGIKDEGVLTKERARQIRREAGL
jgi:hypothetical protein